MSRYDQAASESRAPVVATRGRAVRDEVVLSDEAKAHLREAEKIRGERGGTVAGVLGLSRNAMAQGDFQTRDLSGAQLRNSFLKESDFSNADLKGADLRGTDLRSANLNGADLRGADLTGAKIVAADFRNANLTDARGVSSYQFALTLNDSTTIKPSVMVA
ncbi:MAG: pentapeptide repeat-containing protein [Alphaproteobacteria bacterium]|nr:pentapeptide repeat-containing protein [Alphaproteobacteria bacterium]